MAESSVPVDPTQREGFSAWPTAGRFVPELARIFFRHEGNHLVFGATTEAAHCNGFGIVHGGFISTLADIWLAYNVAHLLPKKEHFATANLQVDFLKGVKAGQWLESRIDRIALGSILCRASGTIVCAGQAIAGVHATFCRYDRAENPR